MLGVAALISLTQDNVYKEMLEFKIKASAFQKDRRKKKKEV